MGRIIAAALALLLGGNGLAMLFAGCGGTASCRGDRHGALQPHFVTDIGAAYLVTGLGAAWFAWKPREGWPALVAGGVPHAASAIHVYDAACGTKPLADVHARLRRRLPADPAGAGHRRAQTRERSR
jgi:hypothetical protein